MADLKKKKFDPYGTGYDEEKGLELGKLYPLKIPKPESYMGEVVSDGESFHAWVWHPELNDYVKHGGSLDPKTGMLLKGLRHPSIHLTIQEEKRLGNEIVKIGDRYFSMPKGMRQLIKMRFKKQTVEE